MKNIISTIAFCFALLSLIAQSTDQAVIIISSASTPDFINEMKKDLKKCDIVFNVNKEIWKNNEELQEFGFSLTNKKTKRTKSFHFRYNDLNRHQIFLIHPRGDGYGEVMADVSYMRTEILPLIVNKSVRRKKPKLFRTYASSGDGYLQFTALKDLEELEERFEETVELVKSIKADQTVGKSISNITYTYNGIPMDNPSGINLMDMTSDVLIETLEDDSKIVNVWSELPLNELVMGLTIVGQE